VKIVEINKVCFVGAGTMGCANAVVAGLAGYKVVIYDIMSSAKLNAQMILIKPPAMQT
jgi:3-hydroxyacyl-CoA dehydrogenase